MIQQVTIRTVLPHTQVHVAQHKRLLVLVVLRRPISSLVGVGDVVLADHKSQYPRRKRTPPPVIHTPDVKGGGKNLSPIIGSPDDKVANDNTSNKKHRSTYANDLDYSDKDNDFLLNDKELNNDVLMIEYMDTKWRSKSTHRGRGNLILGGPEYRDTTNMTEDEKRDYRKTRKDYTDKLRLARMRRDPEGTLPSDTFTGCRTPYLCTEAEVESAGLEVGHTFPTKDLLLMHIAEVVNLRGMEFLTSRSDVLTLGCHGTHFCVEAHHSELNGWTLGRIPRMFPGALTLGRMAMN